VNAGSSKSQLAGLALDTRGKRLYYTDKIQGIIAEITTSGSYRREIVNKNGTQPRAIVVDSNNR